MMNNKGHGMAIPYYILIPLLLYCTVVGRIIGIICIGAALIYRIIYFKKESVSKCILMSVLQGFGLYLFIAIVDIIIFYATDFSVLGRIIHLL